MENKVLDIYGLCGEDITKKVYSKVVLMSLLVVLLGVAFLVLGVMDFLGEGISSLMVVLGVVTLIIAVVMLMAQGKKFFYKKTGSLLHKKEIYIAEKCFNDVVSIFERNSFDNVEKISSVEKSSMRVVFLLSEDRKYLAAVLEKYVPFNFSPVSDVIKFQDEAAEEFGNKMSIIEKGQTKIVD